MNFNLTNNARHGWLVNASFGGGIIRPATREEATRCEAAESDDNALGEFEVEIDGEGVRVFVMEVVDG